MKLTRVVLLLGMIGTYWGTSIAQDIPIYTQFFTNPYIYNPAYAGLEGRPVVTLTHRRQWVGIEDAPVTSNFVFHAPLPLGFNIGLNVSQDEAGIFKSTSGLLTFGYSIGLGWNHFLSFGISGGASSNAINLDGLNPFDPALLGVLDNSASLEGNAGVAYHVGNFNIGLALPKLFKTQTYGTVPFDQGEFDALSNYIITADYMLFIAQGNHALQPYFLYRSYQQFPTQFEGGLTFHIKQIMWIGGMYRQDYGFAGLIGLKLKNGLAFGYAFEQPLSKESGVNASTHEFQLTLGFGKKNEPSKKYSTFLASTQAVKPRRETKEPEVEVVAKEPEPEPEVEEKVMEEPTEEDEEETIDEQIREEVSDVEKADIQIGEIPTEDEIMQAEIEEGLAQVVTRGFHPFELATGHYVMVGAFVVMENAIRMSDQLRTQGYNAAVGYSSEKRLFYVHIAMAQSPEEARTQRDDFRQTDLLKDAWYLQVNNKL